MTGLHFTLFQPWIRDADPAGVAELPELSPQERGLLLSTDSMTENLEHLFSSRVVVEPRGMDLTPMGRDVAAYLDEECAARALERAVWLTAGGRRLVYAHSIIPLERTEDWIISLLTGAPTEPIGKILYSNKVSFIKERIDVGLIRCPLAAGDLGIDKKTTFFARRYILVGTKEGAGSTGPVVVIRAAIMEVFSPIVLPVRPLRA